jgi:hypothetical protein
MWFPAVFVLVAIFGWTGANALIALVATAVALGALVRFGFSGGR